MSKPEKPRPAAEFMTFFENQTYEQEFTMMSRVAGARCVLLLGLCGSPVRHANDGGGA